MKKQMIPNVDARKVIRRIVAVEWQKRWTEKRQDFKTQEHYERKPSPTNDEK